MSRKWTHEEGARVLAVASSMKGAPFVATVARLAALPPQTLYGWLRYGDADAQHDETAESPRALWALEFARIQAAWIDGALKKIASTDKEDQIAARGLTWTLERLQRDVFDLSRAPKEAPKGESAKPAHKRKDAVESAVAALEKPDEPSLQ
jgi:hypothetical protein